MSFATTSPLFTLVLAVVHVLIQSSCSFFITAAAMTGLIFFLFYLIVFLKFLKKWYRTSGFGFVYLHGLHSCSLVILFFWVSQWIDRLVKKTALVFDCRVSFKPDFIWDWSREGAHADPSPMDPWFYTPAYFSISNRRKALLCFWGRLKPVGGSSYESNA